MKVEEVKYSYYMRMNTFNLDLWRHNHMDGRTRSNLRPGMLVDIILKKDQRTGNRTRGVVKNLLTKSPTHPHGIKVRLEDGQVGRVIEIMED
jgi:uncharacterized repeat protein (TIGR03833 family)